MMNITKSVNKEIEKAVLSALRYYAIFNYPLNAAEVHGNCKEHCSIETIQNTLSELVDNKEIYRHKSYYSTLPDIEELTIRRLKGNALAHEKEPKAKNVGRFIYNFPFVRFVGISGSLSKGYADNKSDYDFFIITEKNRLWICRTILHVFKKFTFLFGQQHKFCMNYFIDNHKLEIDEKNLFTAVEIASLVPVKGHELHSEFIEANDWVNDFFPNDYKSFMESASDRTTTYTLKSTMEFFLNILFPKKVNTMLMKLTDIKWRKKWHKKNYPMEDYDLAFKTTLHVSKNHHRNHQKKVMTKLSGLD